MESYREAVNRARREWLEAAMSEAGYNVTTAARMTRTHRQVMYRLLRMYAPDLLAARRPIDEDHDRRRLAGERRALGGNAAWKALDEVRA